MWLLLQFMWVTIDPLAQWFLRPNDIHKIWVRNLVPVPWGHLHRIPNCNKLVHVGQDCKHPRKWSDTRRDLGNLICQKKETGQNYCHLMIIEVACYDYSI